MSQSELDRVFPHPIRVFSEAELARIVADALHGDFGKSYGGIKKISRVTNTEIRTVRNWFNAVNAPGSNHFLLLMQSSPTLMKFTLTILGGDALWQAYQAIAGHKLTVESQNRKLTAKDKTPTKNVPRNVPIKYISTRQVWFLDLLRRNIQVSAKEISEHWQVDIKTAKRDIDALKAMGQIRFTGARKRGHYEIIDD